MRSSKSRSRSKNNRNNRPSGNIVNRVFDSSGPESKVRGTPQQIIDKYNQLARDAQLSNDRVAAENFQQHAEHYLRMLGEAQREMDTRREEQERQNRERQAERDRERAARNERQEREANQQPAPQHAKPASPAENNTDPSQAPQPDVVMDVIGDSPENGLVETPEAQEPAAKPKPRRRPRRKDDAAEPAENQAVAADAPAASPEVAADAPKPRRRRAKPKPVTEEPKAAE